jgi:hypothetical protein
MKCRNARATARHRIAQCLLAVVAWNVAAEAADPPSSAVPGTERSRPARRTAAAGEVSRRSAGHPLEPALRIAEASRDALADVDDYEAMFSKWDIVGGRGYAHSLRMKFRTEPMSVYLRFEAPHAGREVIYVEGRNGGNLLAHESGIKSLVGTVALRPDSPRALSESKHPITHIGLANLLEGIIRQWEAELKLEGVEVLYYTDAKLRGMQCKVIEATHPRPGPDVRFHRTRLYFDKQSGLPVRVEQFGFPPRPGEKPPLLEQYTYWDIRTSVGLTDRDFDVENPEYGF